MGSVVYMHEFRARQLQPVNDVRDAEIDDAARIRYLAILRAAVEEERKLHASAVGYAVWYLGRDAKVRLGDALDNRPVLEVTMLQLRRLVRDYDTETVQRLAEQTIHRGFLRFAVIRGEIGIMAIWRYCP